LATQGSEGAYLDSDIESEVARSMQLISSSIDCRLLLSYPKNTLIKSHDISLTVIRSLASMVKVVKNPVWAVFIRCLFQKLVQADIRLRVLTKIKDHDDW
jgi:hypothetical protein